MSNAKPDVHQAMIDELTRLKAENEKLKAAKRSRIALKVSAKGGLSVYGMQRFPVTLYAEQWRTLISMVPQIEEFLTEHAGELTSKE